MSGLGGGRGGATTRRLLCLGAALALGACARVGAPLPRRLVPAWTADGEAGGDRFGVRAMTAGDVNGDGYDDLIVGAPQWQRNRGRAYLFLGSGKGLAPRWAWSASGSAPDEQFGDRVGQAGDVNGDGLGDFFVAAPGWNGGQGRCLVYHGAARGPGRSPDWTAKPDAFGELFGDCTHPSGDLDGDGFDDLAVGSYGFDGSRGRALLFMGSARGLARRPAWEARGEARGDWFGYGIGAAGDVNGDGFGDLLAGAKYNDQAGPDAGKAYLYLGSSRGPAKVPDWTWTGTAGQANASVRVTTAGDVNGDGYADVLVTSPGSDGRDGSLDLFFGSAGGLAEAPGQHLDGSGFKLDFFGQGACPAGDLDGDGFDDVAVHGRDAAGFGHVLIFRGGAQGLGPVPAWRIDGEAAGDRFGWWVAPAGDLDGDALADLVIGAESHGSGRVYVLYGRQCGSGSPQGPRRPRFKGYLERIRHPAQRI